MNIFDILTLPITLFDNYRENMEDNLGIKYLYKCIIISNIFILIFSILVSNYSIILFYSLGTLFLILSVLKFSPNEMHERAFTKLWKKYKDIDSDLIKDKVLSSGEYVRSFISSSKKRVTLNNNVYYDGDDEILDDDMIDEGDILENDLAQSNNTTIKEDFYDL